MVSCKSPEIDVSGAFKTYVTDTSASDEYSNAFKLSISQSARFNLPEIHKGVDSFELRIWVTGMIRPSRLVILRFQDSNWYCQKYEYFTTDSEIDSFKVESVMVPSEVKTIVDSLHAEQILRLPSQKAIAGFVDKIADGQTCRIEVATKSYFQSLLYHCPEHYDEYNNNKFMELVNFLNKFLNFYSPWCKPYRG
jgi:hypothetical protein